jgi:DNA-binding CsgD family transcriptional regulator
VLGLAPLGEAEAATLVRARLGDAAEPSLCTACHRATGGNPLLLHSLTAALASGEVSPSAEAVRALRGVRLETVTRSLLRRLALLPEGAREVLGATAAFGREARLEEVAELAGLDLAWASVAAAALRKAGILAAGPELAFVHPVVRAAVYEELPSDERRRVHLRAAQLLADRGAPAEPAAVHYLAIDGAGDPAAVSTLREAAREASSRGAPDVAASYLRRALVEPPNEDDRPSVYFELGLAGIAAEEPGSAAQLVGAVHGLPDAQQRAEAALQAAILLTFNGNSTDVISVCDAGLESRESIDPDLLARLEGERALNSFLNPSTVASAVEWVESRREHVDACVAPVAALGAAWMRLAMDCRPAGAEMERLVGMVNDGSLFTHPSGVLAQGAVWVLVIGGRPDLARDVGEAVVAMGEEQGSILIASVGRFWRAVAEFELCQITDAAADSAAAVETALAGAGDEEGLSYILSTRIDSLIEAGEPERAGEVLRGASVADREPGLADEVRDGARLPAELPRRAGFAFLIESRGRLSAALGHPADAVEDLLDAGRRWHELRVRSPVASLWRGDAALLLDRLGERPRALELASEQLELARWAQEPRALAASLRALGEIQGGDSGRALLAEAVTALEGTPARLELARALLSMGRALRRGGERRAARRPLARGLDIAHRGGAARIAEAALQELRLAGARPRRAVLVGPESLTAAERRVAELAVAGSSNREIAQRLFLGLRTVETHLTHAYQKLGISSREQLTGAMSPKA